VVLTEVTPQADDKIVAALIHSSSCLTKSQCLDLVANMGMNEKTDLIKTAFRHLKTYDSVLREFEHIDLHFEVVVSASCFAQLKRHRMATLTCQQTVPVAAAYILTNAHRKRVALKVNARELYHIARLRTDRHAQWDIRETAERMVALGKKVMPLTLMLATGKDGFASLYDQTFTS
jgi:thymidylate synthase ThyX